MAEYIDREKAKRLLHIEYAYAAEQLLDEIPAADAAHVVRCKDCKHFKHYGKTSLLIDGEHIKAGWCYRRVRYNEEYRMPPDGFCSYGERKDKADAEG
jgi:hypothetical protein